MSEFRSTFLNPNDPEAFERESLTPAGQPAFSLYRAIYQAIDCAPGRATANLPYDFTERLATHVMEEIISSGKRKGMKLKLTLEEGW